MTYKELHPRTRQTRTIILDTEGNNLAVADIRRNSYGAHFLHPVSWGYNPLDIGTEDAEFEVKGILEMIAKKHNVDGMKGAIELLATKGEGGIPLTLTVQAWKNLGRPFGQFLGVDETLSIPRPSEVLKTNQTVSA